MIRRIGYSFVLFASLAFPQRASQSATATGSTVTTVKLDFTVSNSPTGTITTIDSSVSCGVSISYDSGSTYPDSHNENCNTGGVGGSGSFSFTGSVNASGITHSHIIVKASIGTCNDSNGADSGTLLCTVDVTQAYIGGVPNSGGNPNVDCSSSIPGAGCSTNGTVAMN